MNLELFAYLGFCGAICFGVLAMVIDAAKNWRGR